MFPETLNSTTDDDKAEKDPAHQEAADGQAGRKFFHPDLWNNGGEDVGQDMEH